MKSLWRRRRLEHQHDEAIREDTKDILVSHRRSLQKVRSTLNSADETIVEEIRRLDAAIEGANR